MITKYFTGIKTIDKIILGLILLFAVTLNNSIFVNQIGYFFPLFILTYLLIIKKDNRFEKNGLELVFILFLTAEFISAIFSVDQGVAFKLFFKRLVLIPVVYTIVAVANDSDKAKLIFKFYIGAALITMLLYIVFAYEHFIAQLYSLESKGPSPFQYVMTAGGLMSFVVVFLFAFLINDKNKVKIKLLQLLAFVIASLALLLSYTRAAWLGAAFGMIFILLIKRKWLLLIPIVIIAAFFLFRYEAMSQIVLYHINGHKPEFIKSITTSGRATDVMPISRDTLILADYEEGIKLIVEDKVVKKIDTPSPATRVWHWKDNYYVVYLIDSRQILIKKENGSNIKVVTTFTSPGLTKDLELKNEKYYVADYDSGLTVFSLSNEKVNGITYKELEGISRVDTYDSTLAIYNAKTSTLNFYSFNGSFSLIDSFHINTGVGLLWLYNGYAFFQTENELMRFSYGSLKVKKLESLNIHGIFRIRFIRNTAYGITTNGDLFKGYITDEKMNFTKYYNFNFTPSDFYISDSTLYLTFNKRNRFLSIVDPYHETNLERINQWKTGWTIFKNNPFFGVGDIDLKDVYAKYKEYYLKENFGHLHNNYIHFLVILGGIGFLIVMFMLFKILQLHLKIYRTVKDIPFVSSYALGATAAFVGFLISGLGEWNFGDQEIITMIWFTLGLNIAFYKSYLKNVKTD